MNFEKLIFQIHWRIREFNERLGLRFRKDIILVYTMGKVGSTSIYYSLKKKFKGGVLFMHRMIKENINAYNEVFIRKGRNPHRSKVGELVLNKMSSKRMKIITLVREPIGRNISDFFQDLEVYFDDHKNINSYDDLTIRSHFMDNYPHDLPLDWFTDEFFRTTKINIYDHPFDMQKKFVLIKNNKIEVLILRVDLKDEKKEQLIKDFLGIDEFEIKRHNIADNKSYRAKYRSFLKNCKFDDEYVYKMLDSDYCRNFYSEKEIDELKLLYGHNHNEQA